MTLSATHKAFFLWTLRSEPKALSRLMGFLRPEVQVQLKDLVQKVQNLDERELKNFSLKELKKFERSFQRTYLPEVHDDWILLRLKDESPHAISAILRHLPADRVKRLLNLLPNDVLARLPKISESYAMAPALSECLKRRFEGYFSLDRIYDATQPFDVKSLVHVKPQLLEKIFLELGYQEIALGLKLLPAKTQDLVLGKLLPNDRLAVEKALSSLKNVSESRHKKAQVHIISQDVGLMSTFVYEVGFLVYSKTLLPDDLPDVTVLGHKFSYAKAESLHKQVNNQVKQNSAATVLAYREELLNVCRRVLAPEMQARVS